MDKAGKVIYVSTFSKSLMPSLRIAYMVLPPILLKKYEEAFIHYSSTVPRLDQHTLARFMKDGHFARHLNRMRKVYKRKLQLLTESLQQYAPTISFSGDEAGMHILINVQTDRDEEALAEVALAKGIRVYGLSEYRKATRSMQPSFLIGFGGLADDQIACAVKQLMDAWNIRKN